MDHEGRLAATTARLEGLEIDALLVTSPSDVRYLTGFSGSNGQVVVTSGGAWFLSDARYAARAADLVEGADVLIYESRRGVTWEGDAGAKLKQALGGAGRLGFDPDALSMTEAHSLRSVLDGVHPVQVGGVVQDLRRSKDPDELQAIRRACAVTDAAFEAILEHITVGATERDLAVHLEFWMRRNGAEAVSFEPIVGSGPLSAHIHHSPSDRGFEKGDLVLMDFGALVDGYCSDMTRTVCIGPAPPEMVEVYLVVLGAQAAGIAAMQPGAVGSDVDAAARRVIEAAGHPEHFGHGLGHGVGLDIHEAPGLSKTSTDVLRIGEVITVEPGMYIPGSGGIRIEDCVLVTDGSTEVLHSAPKDELMEV